MPMGPAINIASSQVPSLPPRVKNGASEIHQTGRLDKVQNSYTGIFYVYWWVINIFILKKLIVTG